jgi:hypothetical protein
MLILAGIYSFCEMGINMGVSTPPYRDAFFLPFSIYTLFSYAFFLEKIFFQNRASSSI